MWSSSEEVRLDQGELESNDGCICKRGHLQTALGEECSETQLRQRDASVMGLSTNK